MNENRMQSNLATNLTPSLANSDAVEPGRKRYNGGEGRSERSASSVTDGQQTEPQHDKVPSSVTNESFYSTEMVDRWSRVIFLYSVFFLLLGTKSELEFSVPLQERFALLQLRSSLGLRAREWRIKSDPCTNWVGIQCLNGRVMGINISWLRRTRRGSQIPHFSLDALQNLTLYPHLMPQLSRSWGQFPNGWAYGLAWDVQASSILLDDKYEVRFGSLSEVCLQEGDTHQNRITKLLRLP